MLIPLMASARVSIYLIPEVVIENKTIIISDVAIIEGDHDKKIGDMFIPQLLYKDCIIDRQELNIFLASASGQAYTIFGNGVKVRFKEIEQQYFSAMKEEKSVIIKKGELVELVVRKKGIVIEMSGRSLQNGTEDDEISVRLNNGKVLKGKPLGAGKVAVCL
jgi:hypothetical protein